MHTSIYRCIVIVFILALCTVLATDIESKLGGIFISHAVTNIIKLSKRSNMHGGNVTIVILERHSKLCFEAHMRGLII